MRFSSNGYYIERYVKCDCCGVLVYDEGLAASAPDGTARTYCGAWCREWQAQKDRGIDDPRVELPFDA